MDRHSARFIDAEELAALTGVSKVGAYKIIQQLNEELKQKGYLIVRGRVIYPYFYERFFGKDDKKCQYTKIRSVAHGILSHVTKIGLANLEPPQKGVLKQRWMPKIMRLILLK